MLHASAYMSCRAGQYRLMRSYWIFERLVVLYELISLYGTERDLVCYN